MVVAAASVLAACGGGGGGEGAAGNSGGPGTPNPPAVAPLPGHTSTQPLITLVSEGATDWVGQGHAYSYGTDNASIQVSVVGLRLRVRVFANDGSAWDGWFQIPGSAGPLRAGSWSDLARGSVGALRAGHLSWGGMARGCSTSVGSVTIHAVEFQAGVLRSLDLSFQQRCDGAPALLRGTVRIGADVMPRVKVLENDAPAVSVVSLRSDVDDYIGGGALHDYDGATATIRALSVGSTLRVTVLGDEQWRGDFPLPGVGMRLAPGTYSLAGAGGWSGEGRGCSRPSGSFTVHAASYDNADALTAIDMDFVQYCDGGAGALRGSLRWDAAAVSAAELGRRPVELPPAGLWSPPAGVIPATGGSAIYLESDRGDDIGQGGNWYAGAAVAPGGGGSGGSAGAGTLSVTESAGLLRVRVQGLVEWDAQFKSIDGATRLQPGYHGIVQRHGAHNPARGGMDWSFDGRGCNTLNGWFMVDSVSYDTSGRLQAVDLRFAQHCDKGVPALRGRVRWVDPSGLVPGTAAPVGAAGSSSVQISVARTPAPLHR